MRVLHFQGTPFTQSKLVRCVKDRVLDVAVDIQKGSPTYGKHVAVELTEDNHRQFFIPKGFAHGFAVLSETAVLQYKCDNFYHTEADGGIPDGVSIVKACKWIKAKSQPKERIAGWDLFFFEMNKLEKKGGTVMFMGSSQKVLDLIVKRAAVDYPHLKVVTYSSPYKPEFSDEDNKAIIDAINAANPDLLWIGMTAPKQEKWTYSHWNELNIYCHVGTIGAVFDFFAGTVERAPIWWQEHGLEWLYRLMKEPKRMWRRYIIGNSLFLWNMVKEA